MNKLAIVLFVSVSVLALSAYAEDRNEYSIKEQNKNLVVQHDKKEKQAVHEHQNKNMAVRDNKKENHTVYEHQNSEMADRHEHKEHHSFHEHQNRDLADRHEHKEHQAVHEHQNHDPVARQNKKEMENTRVQLDIFRQQLATYQGLLDADTKPGGRHDRIQDDRKVIAHDKQVIAEYEAQLRRGQ